MSGMVESRNMLCACCPMCGKMIGKYSGGGISENICARCKSVVVVQATEKSLTVFVSGFTKGQNKIIMMN